METFFATLVFFGVVMAAMGIGVAISGRSLRGSCGGTGSDCACDDEAQKSCALKHKLEAQAQAQTQAEARQG